MAFALGSGFSDLNIPEPTNTASATPPPNAPAINLFVLPLAFNSAALSIAFVRFGFVVLKYLLFLYDDFYLLLR